MFICGCWEAYWKQLFIGPILIGWTYKYTIIQLKINVSKGSVISPILFSIMIANIDRDVGRSLFADDWALWKTGENMNHILKKLQNAIDTVEQWSLKCEF